MVYGGTISHYGAPLMSVEKSVQLPYGEGGARSTPSLSLAATQRYQWAVEEGEQRKLFGETGGTEGTEPLIVHAVVSVYP